MEITLNGTKVELHKSNYIRNGANSLQADCESEIGDGIPFRERYAILSVNLIEESLANDEIAIKTWSENEGMLDQLIEQKVVSEPLRQVETGFVHAAICKLLI